MRSWSSQRRRTDLLTGLVSLATAATFLMAVPGSAQTPSPSPTPTPTPSPSETPAPPVLVPVEETRGFETDISVAGEARAWTFAPRRALGKVRVMFRAPTGRKHRVSKNGWLAWAGAMHGNKLVYQQRRRARSFNSEIRLYNTTRRSHRRLPDSVNSRNFEWAPVIFRRWLAFTRVAPLRSGAERSLLILTDLRSGKRDVIESRQDTGNSIRAGQLSGRYLSWERCTHLCEVLTYDRSTGRKVWMPKPRNVDGDVNHYAASVTPEGTTYFARSGRGCGENVSVFHRPVGGPVEKTFDMPSGSDLDGTWAERRADGSTRLFLDVVRCRSGQYGTYYVDLSAS